MTTEADNKPQETEVDWSQFTDEEIAGMSAPPSAEPSGEEENSSSPDDDPAGEEESTEELDESGNAPEDTDGAGPSGDPESEDEESEDDKDPEGTDTDTSDPDDDPESEATDDDQSSESGEEEEEGEDTDSDDRDFKTLYEELMAPFKAAGREITLDDPQQFRRLAQMGVDYNQKMQHLKPYMKVLRTLEKAELLDEDRINFLIDLNSKNPAAIKKLLKDSSIDPLELDREDDADDYSPTDHSVSDTEMNVRQAFDAIESSEHFERTVEVLTKEWDSTSRQALAGNPNLIGLMHAHIADGTYDQVWDEVVKQRLLGQLVGLSDLAAYDQTGQAMADAGKLADPQSSDANSSDGSTSQASAQDKGSNPKGGKKNTARKRAAKPTKGGPSGGAKPKVPNFLEMSDEEIEKYDTRQLSKF